MKKCGWHDNSCQTRAIEQHAKTILQSCIDHKILSDKIKVVRAFFSLEVFFVLKYNSLKKKICFTRLFYIHPSILFILFKNQLKGKKNLKNVKSFVD